MRLQWHIPQGRDATVYEGEFFRIQVQAFPTASPHDRVNYEGCTPSVTPAALVKLVYDGVMGHVSYHLE